MKSKFVKRILALALVVIMLISTMAFSVVSASAAEPFSGVPSHSDGIPLDNPIDHTQRTTMDIVIDIIVKSLKDIGLI